MLTTNIPNNMLYPNHQIWEQKAIEAKERYGRQLREFEASGGSMKDNGGGKKRGKATKKTPVKKSKKADSEEDDDEEESD